MKVIIDITKTDYELVKNGQIPYSILGVFRNSKPAKETIIYDDGIGHRVYKESD